LWQDVSFLKGVHLASEGRSSGDVAEFWRRAKNEKRAMQRDRYRAVLLAIQGEEAPAIARAPGRSRRSVQDWVYACRDGGIEPLGIKPRPGRPTKLPREREADFKARLEAGPCASDGVCTLRGKDVVRILDRERKADEHIVLIMDQAGWHKSKQLRMPEGITGLLLPSYSPELNPTENLWHYLRSHHLANRTYENYDDLFNAGTAAYRSLTTEVIQSICACPYLQERAN
jgi:transposase